MKKILILMVIVAVAMLFSGSGVARAQVSDEGPWPLYSIPDGKGIILTSPDSVKWTVRGSGTDMPLTGMAYGKDMFVAVGGHGTIVTGLRDGSAWTVRQSGITSDLWAVSVARGIFWAVGAGGTVITSSDGYTWARRATMTPYALRNIAFGKNNFVTIGEQ